MKHSLKLAVLVTCIASATSAHAIDRCWIQCPFSGPMEAVGSSSMVRNELAVNCENSHSLVVKTRASQTYLDMVSCESDRGSDSSTPSYSQPTISPQRHPVIPEVTSPTIPAGACLPKAQYKLLKETAKEIKKARSIRVFAGFLGKKVSYDQSELESKLASAVTSLAYGLGSTDPVVVGLAGITRSCALGPVYNGLGDVVGAGYDAQCVDQITDRGLEVIDYRRCSN